MRVQTDDSHAATHATTPGQPIPLVEDADMLVEQSELLGEEHGGQLRARDRARGRGQQVGAQTLHEHVWTGAS
ncbi:hypothetical protein ACGFNV_40470 [Streptomyces sp. NPDC048751]|uniref:hypothetical protein n=1 Tax=Streptomyces sp. NPDC048751 TaxID=3365591 RepID=UPI003719142D